MKHIGIICEYNPFHNGHKYQLEETRRSTGAETITCIMSGSFMQRGEPAAWDKWTRAEMAVAGGADLVIELPLVYASQSADFFATGGIKLLNQMQVIDGLCFGSESGELPSLDALSSILLEEPEALKDSLREHLGKGLVYPKAYQLSLLEYLHTHTKASEKELHKMSALVSNPNNILGLEYLKALRASQSPIQPITIKRIGSGYSDVSMEEKLSSATAIRNEVRTLGFSALLEKNLPASTLSLLKENYFDHERIVSWELFRDLLFYKLRTSDVSELTSFSYVTEGIENRLLKMLPRSESVEELIENVKTKRFTRTGIQRMLTAILLCIRKEDILLFKCQDTPAYLRVLAFNEKGAELLKEMKKREVPNVITKFASFHTEDPALLRMLELDVRATEVYFSALESGKEKTRKGLMDYLKSPVRYKNAQRT